VPAKQRYVWLIIGFLSLLGCASLPAQPSPASPYAVLSFPISIQLLALDTQRFDPRFPVHSLRVDPGQHTLQFAYTATGPGHSASHNGQHAAPFTLKVQEGITYHFVAKT
jgi:hypothetical protein